MKLHGLKPVGDSRRERNRVGRDVTTGSGKTSGRGHRGQKARSDGDARPGLEGGQLSLFRRLPKRDFTNINHREYAIVNLGRLNKSEGGTGITPTLLVESGVVKNEKSGIKILGNGSLDEKLTVKAHKFSASAAEAIDAKGGAHKVI